MVVTPRDFRDLLIWQRAHALVLVVMQLTREFPREVRYELASQLHRAAISVAANIAEGHTRRGNKAFAAFLDIATASAAEVEYLLLLARDLGYLPQERHEPLDAEVYELRRMMSGLRRKLTQ